jgi:hypothetical protein
MVRVGENDLNYAGAERIHVQLVNGYLGLVRESPEEYYVDLQVAYYAFFREGSRRFFSKAALFPTMCQPDPLKFFLSVAGTDGDNNLYVSKIN